MPGPIKPSTPATRPAAAPPKDAPAPVNAVTEAPPLPGLPDVSLPKPGEGAAPATGGAPSLPAGPAMPGDSYVPAAHPVPKHAHPKKT